MLDEVKHSGCIHMMSTRFFADATNDEFTICHNRMGFPQEIGTQHDKRRK